MKKRLSHFPYNERSRPGWTPSTSLQKPLSPIRSTMKTVTYVPGTFVTLVPGPYISPARGAKIVTRGNLEGAGIPQARLDRLFVRRPQNDKPNFAHHRSRGQLRSCQRLVLQRKAERWLADRAANAGARWQDARRNQARSGGSNRTHSAQMGACDNREDRDQRRDGRLSTGVSAGRYRCSGGDLRTAIQSLWRASNHRLRRAGVARQGSSA